MADVHDKKTRSFNMSRIRATNTKPEILVRKFLHANGYRFRLHDKKLPGRPDIVLRKHNTVIFIHGCFWHGHNSCKYYVTPKTRTDWWVTKILRNKENDSNSIKNLQGKGWKVIVLWECSLKKRKAEETLMALLGTIKRQKSCPNLKKS